MKERRKKVEYSDNKEILMIIWNGTPTGLSHNNFSKPSNYGQKWIK